MTTAGALSPLLAWSADDLFRWALLFVLFVLPALGRVFRKRIEEARGKRRPPAPRPQAKPPRPAPDDDPWGRLLRGEPVELPPPPAAPDPGAPVARKEPAAAAPPRPAPAPPRPAPPVRPPRVDLARPLSDLPAPELARLEQLGDALPSLTEAVPLPTLSPSVAGAPLPAAERPGSGPRGPGGQRGQRGPRADWRRAIVLSEVLAPPLALRDADGGAPRIP